MDSFDPTSRPAPPPRSDPAGPVATVSIDALARGRRLVVIIMLAACAWLAAVLPFWAGSEPPSSAGPLPIVGDVADLRSDQPRAF